MRPPARLNSFGGAALPSCCTYYVNPRILIWLTLVPYEVVGILWGPWPEPEGAAEILRALPLAFLGAPVGGAIGWGISRAALPTLACAVAALTLDLFMGGSIVIAGGRGLDMGLFFWLLPTSLLAGVTYTGLRSFLVAGRPWAVSDARAAPPY